MRSARALVRAMSRIVPRDERAAWREEWLAELEAAAGEGGNERRPTPLVFSLGCVPDALGLAFRGAAPRGLATDVRHALRGLMRAPGFTASAVATLAVGLGTTAVLFSMINGIALRTPPGVGGAGDLVQLGRSVEEAPTWEAFSSRAFEEIQAGTTSLESVAGWSVHSFALGEPGQARYVTAHFVTGGYFRTLETPAVVGRLIEPSDDVDPGAHPVVVLSHALWTSEFGRDRGVVGRTVRLDGAPFEVLGVAPEGFVGLHTVGARPEIFVPSMMNPGYQGSTPFTSWRWQWLNAFGRLADGATVEAAADELSGIAFRLRSLSEDQEGVQIVVSGGIGLAPWDRDRVLRLTTMAGIVCALLYLLASTAVANLVLARSLGRGREIGVRMTLGVGRGRVARGLLVESLLISGAAALVAVPLAMALDNLLPALVPLPVVASMSVDGNVLAFIAAVALLTGVLMAWGPTRLAAEARSGGLASSLRGGLPRHSRLRDGLVVAQLALSMGLVAGAALLGRSMLNVWTADPGFDPRGVIATGIELPEEGGDDAPDDTSGAATYLAALLAEVEARPGVRAAAVATQLPIAGGQNFGGFAPADRPDDAVEGESLAVTGGYFETLGVPILRGRAFRRPTGEPERVAIVSTATAELFWPGEDPIGKELRGDPAWRVVGVVPDARLRSLRSDPIPTVYYPIPLSMEGRLHLLAGSQPGTTLPAGLVAEAVAAVGGPPSATGATDLFAAMVDSMAETKVIGYLVGAFAVLSLLLSVLGLYGLVSYIARRQSREFGVRLTLGASPAHLRGIVLRRSLRLAGAGLLGGLVVAAITGRILSSALYEVGATDPTTLVATAVVLAVSALLAVWVPARRAARVDPVVSLRDV